MSMHRALSCAAAAVILLGAKAPAATLDEAALRIALSVARQVSCVDEGQTYFISGLPIEDASRSLSAGSLDQLQAEFFGTLNRELPSCVQISEASAAFGTLEYLQNIGQFSELGTAQRERIEEQLAGADAILGATVARVSGSYTATVELTSLRDGLAIVETSFQLDERYGTISCGSGAVAEANGLEVMAEQLIDRLSDGQTLLVASATYQATDNATNYGSYLADRFRAALSALADDPITNTEISVRIHPGADLYEPAAGEYEITLSYWPCEDLSATQLNVVVTSENGDVFILAQELSLSAVPAALEVVPPADDEVSNPADVDAGILVLSPSVVGLGEELTVTAEPPVGCRPFFFNLSETGRLTPLPLEFFEQSEILPGVLRYDINSNTDFGLVVTPEDEPGVHRLGFVCQPENITRDGIRDIFRRFRSELEIERQGVIEVDGEPIIYNLMSYDIVR